MPGEWLAIDFSLNMVFGRNTNLKNMHMHILQIDDTSEGLRHFISNYFYCICSHLSKFSLLCWNDLFTMSKLNPLRLFKVNRITGLLPCYLTDCVLVNLILLGPVSVRPIKWAYSCTECLSVYVRPYKTKCVWERKKRRTGEKNILKKNWENWFGNKTYAPFFFLSFLHY